MHTISNANLYLELEYKLQYANSRPSGLAEKQWQSERAPGSVVLHCSTDGERSHDWLMSLFAMGKSSNLPCSEKNYVAFSLRNICYVKVCFTKTTLRK